MSLAGAMSLLASFKPGRNGRCGAREKQDFSASNAVEQQASRANTPLSSPEDDQAGQADTGKSHWRWLDRAIVALWIAMLLSIIAYALIGGEVVMAQLDGLDLVAAYSLSP